MENNDTIRLLRECDAGTKMAVTSINEVLEYVQNPDLVQLLTKSKDHHGKLGNEIHSLLLEYDSQEKEPAAMAKGMSWLKTNMKIKSLYKYLNQYKDADEEAKKLCNKLIDIEEELCRDLRKFL